MRFHSLKRILAITWITHSEKTITRYNDSKAKVPRNKFLEVQVGICVVVIRSFEVVVHARNAELTLGESTLVFPLFATLILMLWVVLVPPNALPTTRSLCVVDAESSAEPNIA
jgi:hypothetical protein